MNNPRKSYDQNIGEGNGVNSVFCLYWGIRAENRGEGSTSKHREAHSFECTSLNTIGNLAFCYLFPVVLLEDIILLSVIPFAEAVFMGCFVGPVWMD